MKLNRRILLHLIPGLLPLFVFVVAEKLWGMETGVLIAVGFGILELFIGFLSTGRFERFIFLDISLIVLLGLISLFLNNEIFFRLKPALIEIILAGVLFYSAFGKRNLLHDMSKRYLKGVKIAASAELKMTRSLRVLFWIILLHSLLVIYAAFYLSRETWAFIGGVLFYILIGVYFLYMISKDYISKRNPKLAEWLPMVDESGSVTGKARRELFHFNPNKKILHPVVHLHVFNEEGKIFLQQRPASKNIQPNKWDTAVGGHVAFGETVETALKRETIEEIGLAGFQPVHIGSYIWETEVEREMVFMFYTHLNIKPEINHEELADGRFWDISEIEENLDPEEFTPNFIHEFKMLKEKNIIMSN